MFENNPDSTAARLDALIAKAQGKHRAADAPLVVFASSSGGAGPPGRLRALLHGILRRRLPDPALLRRPVIYAGVLAGVALAVALSLWWRHPEPEAPPDLPMAAAEVTKLPDHAIVNVVGEVPKPGLVTVTSGARVAEAVQAAGGPNPDADLRSLNLARRVTDGEQIAVGMPAHAPDSRPEPLNLNTATKEQLDELPGVGPVTAQRIVERRLKRGPFTSVDQLGEIEGIGDTKLAKLGDLVRL
ncbi:competence protein ComEA [Saccharothrix tamanrassetensis]|uniref:Competence protein ComEA n=1 Tax=Saccharothrix tamanrassetensis TaxID=1051531 RepID=A0A841CGU6_9PSEU|nr:ComEA family DNA-binding protein [Saccharothrix tamanrassetensis]MBB5957752.1 competence protein ComEA [Saccharothrix tamanrassetensis]